MSTYPKGQHRVSSTQRASMRWSGGHNKKVVHRMLLGAKWHAFRLNLPPFLNGKRSKGQKKWTPYECRWGQQYRDGEIAPLHYHVGRRGKWMS